MSFGRKLEWRKAFDVAHKANPRGVHEALVCFHRATVMEARTQPRLTQMILKGDETAGGHYALSINEQFDRYIREPGQGDRSSAYSLIAAAGLAYHARCWVRGQTEAEQALAHTLQAVLDGGKR